MLIKQKRSTVRGYHTSMESLKKYVNKMKFKEVGVEEFKIYKNGKLTNRKHYRINYFTR